jgi:hypothetical protein
MMVGIPVAIGLAPISYTISALSSDDEEQAWGILYPASVCRDGGAVLFGGIPFLIVGDRAEETR